MKLEKFLPGKELLARLVDQYNMLPIPGGRACKMSGIEPFFTAGLFSLPEHIIIKPIHLYTKNLNTFIVIVCNALSSFICITHGVEYGTHWSCLHPTAAI